MRARRSPAFIISIAALVGLVLAAISILMICRQPQLGLTFAAGDQGRTPDVIRDVSGIPAMLPLPVRLHTMTAGNGRSVTLQTSDLVDDPDAIATYAGLDTFYVRQTAIAELMASGPLRLEFATRGGPVSVTMQPRARSVTELPDIFWIQIVTGLVALVIGGWVFALRPGDIATRLFALAGIGLAICLFPVAVYTAREIALPGDLFALLLVVSVTGAWTMGAALISLFLVYPARLAGTGAVITCFALCLAVPVLRLLRWSPTPLLLAQATAVLAMAALAAVIALQWRATRRDPRQRAIVRWFGVSVGLGCGAYVAMVNVPLLFGMPTAIPQSYAVATFLLIYGGAALGVARTRLFALDALAFRILLLLAAGAAVLGMDAILAFGLNMATGPSMGLAFLATLLLYLPLRDVLWRRLTRRQPPDRTRLFQLVTEAAFDSQGPQARWEQVLRYLFDPLEIAPLEDAPLSPQLQEEGLTLALPAMAGAPALRLRHARGGRGLFTPADARLAREIIALLESAHRRRDAYEQGVLTERVRIARDLHDDVGARLLSALHMAEDGVRPVLHAALDDIRAIVAGLGGERKSFGRVVADLRHETARRLEALGIALDWPAPGDREAEIPLSYAAYRNLSSAMREVMSNVMRHAGASAVIVRITCEGHRISATIQDNGRGSSAPREGRRQGNGVRNLTARMQALGGDFTMALAPEGARVSFWFSLDTGANTPEQGVSEGARTAMVDP